MVLTQTSGNGGNAKPLRWQVSQGSQLCMPPGAESAARQLAAHRNLTSRESEIVSLICRGMKNSSMASELGLSTPTIRFHIRNLHKKLGTSDKLDVVLSVWGRQPQSSKGLDSATRSLASQKRLTERESQIMTLICRGLKNGSMAGNLGLSMPTVRFHLRNLHKKLGTSDKVDVVLQVWNSLGQPPAIRSSWT